MNRSKLSRLQKLAAWFIVTMFLALLFSSALQKVLTMPVPIEIAGTDPYSQSDEALLQETMVSAIIGSMVAAPVSWYVVETGTRNWRARNRQDSV